MERWTSDPSPHPRRRTPTSQGSLCDLSRLRSRRNGIARNTKRRRTFRVLTAATRKKIRPVSPTISQTEMIIWVLFWVTAGIGLDELVSEYESQGDTYSALIAKAWADRFAESLAEWLHREVRTKHWGFVPDETLSVDELLAEKYVGIRPAPGYPACPDHRHKQVLYRLLQAERIGASLSESCAMSPAASVAGFYFAAKKRAILVLARSTTNRLQTSPNVEKKRKKPRPAGSVPYCSAESLSQAHTHHRMDRVVIDTLSSWH